MCWTMHRQRCTAYNDRKNGPLRNGWAQCAHRYAWIGRATFVAHSLQRSSSGRDRYNADLPDATHRAVQLRDFWMIYSTKWSDNESSILWRSFVYLEVGGPHCSLCQCSNSHSKWWRCVDVKARWISQLKMDYIEPLNACMYWMRCAINSTRLKPASRWLLDWCQFARYWNNRRLINVLRRIDWVSICTAANWMNNHGPSLQSARCIHS